MNYLTSIRISDHEADAFIKELIALPQNATKVQQKNTEKLRDELRARYHQAPDLTALAGTGYRLINAVSDFATHTTPLRQTRTIGKTSSPAPSTDTRSLTGQTG